MSLLDGSSPTAESRQSALLSLQNVGRTYVMGEVRVEVLRKVTLDVMRGEFLGIVGPSGSGKTTILNMIGGLDSPTTGRVVYYERSGERSGGTSESGGTSGGPTAPGMSSIRAPVATIPRDLTTAKPAELTRYRRDEVGFVFQFYNLVPTLTARENVMVSTEISRRPRDVDEVLNLVGLGPRAGHFPSQMSGGEQQRVAIARAVAKNPELLLCDEPTGALDFETGKRVLRLLVDLNRQLGKTVIVITHNVALAQVADRVIHLRSGEITQIDVNEHPIAPEEVIW